MKCECGGVSRVIDSRPYDNYIRRRRKCVACDERFTTYEFQGDDLEFIGAARRMTADGIDSIVSVARDLDLALGSVLEGVEALRLKADKFWNGH